MKPVFLSTDLETMIKAKSNPIMDKIDTPKAKPTGLNNVRSKKGATR